MGSGWGGLRFLRRIQSLQSIAPSDKPPFYETNLFWGCLGTAFSAVLTVIGMFSRTTLAHWLLSLALPFAAIALWSALSPVRSKVWRTVSASAAAVLIAVLLFQIDSRVVHGVSELVSKAVDPKMRQRFLAGEKIGDATEALFLAKGYRVYFMRGGSFEAEALAAQLKLAFEGSGWEVFDGRVFPPRDISLPIIIQGASPGDAGVLAAKSALLIAGFKIEFKEEKVGPPRSITLYF